MSRNTRWKRRTRAERGARRRYVSLRSKRLRRDARIMRRWAARHGLCLSPMRPSIMPGAHAATVAIAVAIMDDNGTTFL